MEAGFEVAREQTHSYVFGGGFSGAVNCGCDHLHFSLTGGSNTALDLNGLDAVCDSLLFCLTCLLGWGGIGSREHYSNPSDMAWPQSSIL